MDTVKVKCPITTGNADGFYIINKSDLTDKHELLEEAEEVEKFIEDMTKAQLQAHLHRLGVEFSATDNKARLLELCPRVPE